MWRLGEICRIFIKYNLGRFSVKGTMLATPNIRLTNLPLVFILFLLLWCGKLFGNKKLSKEVALRKALEELGPIFIKFGQILSTRGDILPAALITELSFLQDRVPPCDNEEIKQIVRQSLGGELSDHFSEFETECYASASVAQVHFGVLKKEGVQVAIKVIKPGIHQQIKKDIKMLYLLADFITGSFDHTNRLRLDEVVREFEYTLENELDMQQEGANASQLRRNFSNYSSTKASLTKKPAAPLMEVPLMEVPFMEVPLIYWDYTRVNVLVMERINGVAINNIQEFKKHNIDLKMLAEKGVSIFFTQVFRDSFFHADMHPGNIFVDISDPTNPVYKGVDFGIMGSLSEADKKYLALNFIAFFNRDYRRVAELHINCGWVSRDTRVEQLEAAVRGVCEPIFAKPLNEIPFGQVLTRLLQTAKKFNMEVQPQLLLLQKTLINVEGLGRQLYPQLNIWETATPYLKDWLAKEVGVCNFVESAQRIYPELLVRLPNFASALMMSVENMGNNIKAEPKIKVENARLRRSIRKLRLLVWMLGGGIILAGSGIFLLAT